LDRPLHDLRGIIGNMGKITKKQLQKIRFSSYFRSEFKSGDETFTVDIETPFLRLLAFLS